MSAMKLSVLDQSPAAQGRAQDVAIRESLALAKACDELGYHRYWVSEHHNSASIVGTAPEILMAAIAATTRRIRVGSAGVMLPHYSALKVAEQFRVLEAHRAGADRSRRGPRAGLGPAHRVRAQSACQCGRRVPAAGARACRLGRGHAARRTIIPFARSPHTRRGPTSPEIWILGSSDYGARLAAHFGLPYAFAYFFSDGLGVDEALPLYRRNYRPSARYPQPVATICVWALAADTEAEARRLFTTREYWRVGFEQGLRNALVSPEEAVAHPYTAAERARIDELRRKAFVGTAEQVAAGLTALAQRLELGELVVNTWTFDPRRAAAVVRAAGGGVRARTTAVVKRSAGCHVMDLGTVLRHLPEVAMCAPQRSKVKVRETSG